MNRAARRREAKKLPGRISWTMPEMLRLKYDLTIPGGALRSPYPSTTAGVIESGNEAELLRNVLSMIIEQSYALTPREEFAKVFAGIMCDVLNPAGDYVRSLVAYGLQAGLGLLVQPVKQEVCLTCKRAVVAGEEFVHAEVTDGEGETIAEHAATVIEDAVLIDNVRRYPALFEKETAEATVEMPDTEQEPSPELAAVLEETPIAISE